MAGLIGLIEEKISFLGTKVVQYVRVKVNLWDSAKTLNLLIF